WRGRAAGLLPVLALRLRDLYTRLELTFRQEPHTSPQADNGPRDRSGPAARIPPTSVPLPHTSPGLPAPFQNSDRTSGRLGCTWRRVGPADTPPPRGHCLRTPDMRAPLGDGRARFRDLS